VSEPSAEVPDVLYAVIGGLVIGLFILKRELLTDRKAFLTVLGISIILSVLGICIHFSSGGGNSMSGALLAPLLDLGLYRLLRAFYIQRVGSEPRDTYLIWTPGMPADRIFNIVYLTLALLLWIFVAVII